MCKQYGMTEEQFWQSNPRIIKVWEKCWENEQNRQNLLVHMWMGNYALSANITALSQVLTPMFCKGKQSQAKYIEEPIELFEKTEEEKQADYDATTQAFLAWGNAVINNYKKA